MRFSHPVLCMQLLLSAAVSGGCDSAASAPKQHRNAIHVATPSDAAASDVPDADSGGEASRAEQRRACAFGAEALAEDTLDPGAPTGAAIPIDHFVVIMQENRSFDHYFQAL